MQSLKSEVARTNFGRSNPTRNSSISSKGFSNGVLKDHLFDVALKRAKKKRGKRGIMLEGVRNSKNAKG